MLKSTKLGKIQLAIHMKYVHMITCHIKLTTSQEAMSLIYGCSTIYRSIVHIG